MVKDILVVPDVHGRSFWKDDVAKALESGSRYDLVVFTGDYLDPYPHEGIEFNDAWNNFQEILETKRQHYDKIILLLGNHDIHYFVGDSDSRGSRYDYEHAPEIRKAFLDNIKLFDMYYEEREEDDYPLLIFSHAGIHPRWVVNADLAGQEVQNERTAFVKYIKSGAINNMLHSCEGREPGTFIESVGEKLFDGLMHLSSYRTSFWAAHTVGSMVWSDIREWADPRFKGIFENIVQIFGHTQLKNPCCIGGRGEDGRVYGVYDLDARKCFRVDRATGTVCDMDGTPVMPMSKKVAGKI